jgi:hypothetical protein
MRALSHAHAIVEWADDIAIVSVHHRPIDVTTIHCVVKRHNSRAVTALVFATMMSTTPMTAK